MGTSLSLTINSEMGSYWNMLALHAYNLYWVRIILPSVMAYADFYYTPRQDRKLRHYVNLTMALFFTVIDAFFLLTHYTPPEKDPK